MSRRNRKKKQTSLLDDLKSTLASMEPKKWFSFWYVLPSLHQKILKVLIPVFFVLLIIPIPENEPVTQPTNQPSKRVEVGVDTTSLSEQRDSGEKVVRTADWQEYTVQSGDTLSKVFRSNELPIKDLNALIAIEGLDKPLSKIKQGQLIRFKRTEEGSLDILQLEKQGTSVMFFRLSDGGFGRSK